MKLLLTLLVATVLSTSGAMLGEGTLKYVSQIGMAISGVATIIVLAGGLAD